MRLIAALFVRRPPAHPPTCLRLGLFDVVANRQDGLSGVSRFSVLSDPNDFRVRLEAIASELVGDSVALLQPGLSGWHRKRMLFEERCDHASIRVTYKNEKRSEADSLILDSQSLSRSEGSSTGPFDNVFGSFRVKAVSLVRPSVTSHISTSACTSVVRRG